MNVTGHPICHAAEEEDSRAACSRDEPLGRVPCCRSASTEARRTCSRAAAALGAALAGAALIIEPHEMLLLLLLLLRLPLPVGELRVMIVST